MAFGAAERDVGAGVWGGVAVASIVGAMVGVVAGSSSAVVWGSALVVLALLGLMSWRWWRGGAGPGGAVLLVAWGLAMCAWAGGRQHGLSADDVSAWVTADGALTRVTGRIAEPVVVRGADGGTMGGFVYQGVRSLTTLHVSSLATEWGATPASGRLLLKVDAPLTGVSVGDEVSAVGWLSAVEPTANPGEFDYAAWLARRGIAGRLAVDGVAQLTVVSSGVGALGAGGGVLGWRERLVEAARASLGLGLVDPSGERRALAEALLLGRRSDAMDELRQDFAGVGLAHLLSISGAHLAILLGLVWLVARGLTDRPSRAATVVLVAMALYLVLVPAKVPVVRAALMAAMLLGPLVVGRRVSGVRAWCLAAVLVLIWRPFDVLDAGAQLSFLAVLAMMRFTSPLAGRWRGWVLGPTAGRGLVDAAPDAPPDMPPAASSPGVAFAGLVVDVTAASTVAFLVSLPLVAFHFGMVSPLSIPLSVAAVPMLTAVLGLGFFKMIVGLALPSVSALLGGPMGLVTGVLIALVRESASWPGASLLLSRPVGVGWVVAALAVVTAWLGGMFRRRRVAGLVAAVIVTGWFAGSQRWLGTRDLLDPDTSAVRLAAIAVGDGSSFLVRSGGETLLFDCGSQGYPEIGRRSVLPALRYLGVTRIDTLILSHSDLDHYSGVPEVVDVLPVKRVLASPEVFTDAAEKPGGATAYLLDYLASRRLNVQPITRGWTGRLGEATLEAHWPPAGFVAKRSNDHSVVLSINAAGRTLLLNGDVQDAAIRAMAPLGLPPRADVTDLPHHGSFGRESVAWLQRVEPAVVIQSSGPARLRHDRWAEPLEGTGITRLITDRMGLCEVVVEPDGRLWWWWYGRGDGGGRASLEATTATADP